MSGKKDFSEKLRSAKYEIAEILKKHNIAGSIILADGEGMGEFGFFIDTPNWSGIYLNEFGFRIKMNSKTEEAKTNANKSVNAAVVLRDCIGNQFLLADALVTEIKKHVKVEDTGPFPPQTHREGNYLQ